MTVASNRIALTLKNELAEKTNRGIGNSSRQNDDGQHGLSARIREKYIDYQEKNRHRSMALTSS
jgi:hypothetical protein